ncbi:MAG: PDZ domain-containing protein [candidate division WOR-3 bacterium]|nr:MAG: PDZ domain-containing protein [candidate division WOR-3 bacterium]
MRQLLYFVVSAALMFTGCEPGAAGPELGATYYLVARPEVWQVLPLGQAEKLGIRQGDMLLLYDGEPVASNDEVRRAQGAALGGDGQVPLVLLRDEEELEVMVDRGPLGVLPVAAKYPSSLALALEDILRHHGRFADYDWLVALTGEAFTFTAEASECRAWWPGGRSDAYLDRLAKVAGVGLRSVYGTGEQGEAAEAVRAELAKGRAVLVQGGWPEHRGDFWGVASRFDPGEPKVYGYSLDSGEEMLLSGSVIAAFVVEETGQSWMEPARMLATVLTQALELSQAHADSGWKSGIDAWDLLIKSLYQGPFCPVCGEAESQVCFDRLVWVTIAHRESAVRFLEAMSQAVPSRANLLSDAIADNRAILGKLEGIVRSGVQVGDLESRRKLALVFSEIELIENDLVGNYEQILSGQ